MMFTLDAIGQFHIERPQGTYVYDFVPISSGLAVISSDECLRVIDPLSLHSEPSAIITNVNSDLTCLEALDTRNSMICTAGRDGFINIYDLRSRTKVSSLKTDQGAAILSLSVSLSTSKIAAGTELANYQAAITIWDIRSLQNSVVCYAESHSDDITELRYHPTNASILLSGSTDGLVNIFNTSILEEEDALHQTINHGASIHHAGFLNELDIFALSHDEKFSTFKLITDADEKVEEPPPQEFGDLRPHLNCEYVANVIPRPDGGAVLGVGFHSQEAFDLIQFRKFPPWSCVPESRTRLSGGHGQDIVRTFCFIDDHRMILTGGEDGKIKAWKVGS